MALHTPVCVTGTTPRWFVMSVPTVCTETNKQTTYSELNKTTLLPILLFPLNLTNTGSFVAVNTGESSTMDGQFCKYD